MTNPIRKTRSALVALALTLALASPTLAATSDSGTMTLTVGNAISVDGVPDTIAFGSTLGNETLSAPAFDVTVSANTSATFTAAATDLSNGTATINASAVSLSLDGGGAVPANGAPIASYGASGGSDTQSVLLTIDVPAAQQAGEYTGTFTISGS